MVCLWNAEVCPKIVDNAPEMPAFQTPVEMPIKMPALAANAYFPSKRVLEEEEAVWTRSAFY